MGKVTTHYPAFDSTVKRIEAGTISPATLLGTRRPESGSTKHPSILEWFGGYLERPSTRAATKRVRLTR